MLGGVTGAGCGGLVPGERTRAIQRGRRRMRGAETANHACERTQLPPAGSSASRVGSASVAPSVARTCRIERPPVELRAAISSGRRRRSRTSRRVAVDPASARARARVVDDARAQDAHRRSAEVGEGAGIRRRDGAHQVVDCAGGPRPVDAAVLGLAAAEIAALREILCDARRRAREQRGQRALEQRLGGRASPCRTLRRPCRRAGSAPRSARRCRRRRASSTM